MKGLTINSHSLCTADKSDVAWRNWFRALKLALSALRINPDNVVWTFDDFYRNEAESLSLLERFGFSNLVVLYCPDLLGKEDARTELRNPDVQCAIGTPEELHELQTRFPNLRFGVHTLIHTDYEKAGFDQLNKDLEQCQTNYKDLFQRPASLFAFPYGRAKKVCIVKACEKIATVYLSDNRIPYTEDKRTGLINRVHLELGGNIPKFIAKVLVSRLRTRTSQKNGL